MIISCLLEWDGREEELVLRLLRNKSQVAIPSKLYVIKNGLPL
jgi:hypothetical protein